jgi:hypothetical protein
LHYEYKDPWGICRYHLDRILQPQSPNPIQFLTLKAAQPPTLYECKKEVSVADAWERGKRHSEPGSESELELGLSEDRTGSMDYLQSVLSYRRQWQKPDALLSPTLSSISLEILLCITDYLPPKSAVAFSLSCSHLKRLLSPQQFSKLASSTEHKLVLLNL